MKKNNILVSIIVPVYNVEKYLEKCINSIINQTYKNIEIIFVDDGSTDSSSAILDNYLLTDSRIKVIHTKNRGVSNARNTGLSHSTGEYVCFADADDYLFPDYVEYLLKLAYDNDVEISLTTEMFTTFRQSQSKNIREKILTGEDTTTEILIYNIPIGVYCKMFKRDFLIKNNVKFCTNIFIGEGFNFNTYAFQRANKVAISNKKIYFYRRDNPSSATTKYSIEKWKNALFAIDNIENNLIIKTRKVLFALKFARWHTTCDAFNFMVIAGAEKKYKNEYKEYKKVVHSRAYYSFLLKIPFREKIRAILFIIYPRIVPILIKLRNRKYFK